MSDTCYYAGALPSKLYFATLKKLINIKICINLSELLTMKFQVFTSGNIKFNIFYVFYDFPHLQLGIDMTYLIKLSIQRSSNELGRVS
jgi:hypothetical protein